uniref:Uncharacterized protein n=1 Tax=Amphimedon queenslandica TaxID=400682 RepID=A0A1X7U9I1_AMPQE
MKAENRIYHLKWSEEEVEVNDYNPLLLLLLKTNIDVLFTGECSLALANYVSGYVTMVEGVTCRFCELALDVSTAD